MTTKADLEAFVSLHKLALVGVSRTEGKFSNAAYKELKTKGYRVFGVNRSGGTVDGDVIYPSLASLPEPVEGAVVFVKPEGAAAAVQDCAAQGIQRVWLQQGAQSEEALKICAEKGIHVVSGECILMFAGKSGFHKFHRFFRDAFGKKLA